MISLSQIKAARGLLDWTQEQLARAAGLSLPAVANIERGAANPRAETLRALYAAFEKQGVEFTDEPGVRMRREAFDVQVLHGYPAIKTVWDDIERVFADGKGGTVLLANLDDRDWEQRFGADLIEMLKRRQKLNIITRILVNEQDDYLVRGVKREWARRVSAEVFSLTPYYVYADKVALMYFAEPMRIILIHNARMAETFSRQFEFFFRHGRVLRQPRE